jgi:hypothetical protein
MSLHKEISECRTEPAKFVSKQPINKPVCERRKYAEPTQCDLCTCGVKPAVHREIKSHSSNIDDVIVDAYIKGETIPEIASRLWTHDKEVWKEIWKDGVGMVKVQVTSPTYLNFIRHCIKVINNNSVGKEL